LKKERRIKDKRSGLREGKEKKERRNREIVEKKREKIIKRPKA